MVIQNLRAPPPIMRGPKLPILCDFITLQVSLEWYKLLTKKDFVNTNEPLYSAKIW